MKIAIGFGIGTSWIGGGGGITLPAGQAILFSRGQATVSFVGAETAGATLSATGAGVASFVGDFTVLGNGTLSSTGAATVSFVGFSTGGGGGGTTGQPMGLLLALTYPT